MNTIQWCRTNALPATLLVTNILSTAAISQQKDKVYESKGKKLAPVPFPLVNFPPSLILFDNSI